MKDNVLCLDCGNEGVVKLSTPPSDCYQGDCAIAVRLARAERLSYAGCSKCSSPNVFFSPTEEEKLDDHGDFVDDLEDSQEEDDEEDFEVDDAESNPVTVPDDEEDEDDYLEDDDLDNLDEDDEGEIELPEPPRKKKRKKKKKKKSSSDDRPVKKKKRKKKKSESDGLQLAPESKTVASNVASGDLSRQTYVAKEVSAAAVEASDVPNEICKRSETKVVRRRQFKRECRECCSDFQTKHEHVMHCKKCLRRFSRR